MDVTQIHIKTNQTNQLDGGKPNSSIQTEAPVNSFDQILAMIHLLGRLPGSEGQSTASFLKKVSERTDSDQNDPTNLSAEDWSQLDTILTAWLVGIQQVQLPTVTPQLPSGNHFSTNGSQLPIGTTMFSPLQQVSTEISKALTQWLQKVEGTNQTSAMDQSQLVQRLAQFIGELKLQEKQTSFEVPNDIGDKIQMILSESKTENQFTIKTSLNSQLHQNGLLFDDKAIVSSLESKPRLSMDKNQVAFSSISDQGSSFIERNSFVQVPFTMQVEGTSKPDVLSPPVLSVSEFIPEISEWIGRYMESMGDQSGGGEAKFSLYPSHLGQIEIKITSLQGQVSAQIVTETQLTRETLEGQLQQLRQALQQQGLQIKKLDIVQQSPVSIDLNQSNLPSLSDRQTITFATENSNQEGSRFVPVPLSSEAENLTKSNGLMLSGNNQLLKPEGSNVSEDVSSPPILSVSEFVPEVSEWIRRYTESTGGRPGSTEAEFSLNPDHLGQMEIKMISQQGQVSVQIVTGTLLAKETLTNELQQLRQALEQHGLLVLKIDIAQQAPVSMNSNQANLPFSQGGFSTSPEQRTIIATGTSKNVGSRFVPVPLSPQAEDLTKSNGLTFLANQQLQGPYEGNVSKTVLSPHNLPIAQFIPEVSEWIDRYMRITGDQPGSTEAKFSLNPEHLGHIEIKITSQLGQVSAQIITDTPLAKEALEGQLSQLKQALQQHGILVQKLDIVQQTPVAMDSNQANLSFSQGGSSSSNGQQTFTSDEDLSKEQTEADQKEIVRETLSISYGGAAPKIASLIDFTA